MSPEDVAAYLGVPLKTVYEWRAKSYGPPFSKIGKHLRARRSAVDSWVDAQQGDAPRQAS